MLKKVILIFTLVPVLPSAGLVAMDADGAAPIAPAAQNGVPVVQECPICLTDLNPNELNSVINLCEGQQHSHSFHTRCIVQAQARDPRCSICRRMILPVEQQSIRDAFVRLDPEAARKIERDARNARLKKIAVKSLSWGSILLSGASIYFSTQELFFQSADRNISRSNELRASVSVFLAGVTLMISNFMRGA